MKTFHQASAVPLLGLGLLMASAVAHAETVTCESRNGSYQSCAVNTSGGVTLARQLSSQGCWEGDTWGYDRNRIWVNNGCRAEFDVGRASSSSGNNNAAVAAVAVGVIAAALIASNRKKHDRDDDYNDGNWGNPRQTIRCESVDNRYNRCSTGRLRGQVEVYRQLSDRRCVYGQNWGSDRSGIWVNGGCRAEFAVY